MYESQNTLNFFLGANFTKVVQLIDGLESRIVDGALVDSLVAADMADKLAERKMKLSKIIPENSGWGIILSGELLKLEEEIRSYIVIHAKEITAIIENRTSGKLMVKRDSYCTCDIF